MIQYNQVIIMNINKLKQELIKVIKLGGKD